MTDIEFQKLKNRLKMHNVCCCDSTIFGINLTLQQEKELRSSGIRFKKIKGSIKFFGNKGREIEGMEDDLQDNRKKTRWVDRAFTNNTFNHKGPMRGEESL